MVAHFFYIQNILINCVDCNICVNECSFLQEHGTPREIAENWCEYQEESSKLSYHCSLCGLCTAVCPKKLDPCAMFLTTRRIAVEREQGHFKEHKTILNYEKRGTSERFSHYYFPEKCDTIFFPGCALPGSRPDTLWKFFLLLREKYPRLGIVLDCCTKPTHDLGREKQFNTYFQELLHILTFHSIQNVLVACPSCYGIFTKYGEGLQVKTVYELLNREENRDLLPEVKKAVVAVHDSCSTRFVDHIHQDIRDLLKKIGLELKEMTHNRKKTFCCGEGGSVPFLRPDLAREWTNKRLKETDNYRVMTYCAGCTHFLRKGVHTDHILDLVIKPEQTMAGKAKASRTPITYTNRWRLKKRLQKHFKDGVSGSRQQLRLKR